MESLTGGRTTEAKTSNRLTRSSDDLVLEDNSGGYRIEPFRPGGVIVGFRPFEVRPGEVRPSEVRPGEVRPSEVRPFEVRPGKVRRA